MVLKSPTARYCDPVQTIPLRTDEVPDCWACHGDLFNKRSIPPPTAATPTNPARLSRTVLREMPRRGDFFLSSRLSGTSSADGLSDDGEARTVDCNGCSGEGAHWVGGSNGLDESRTVGG